MKVLDQKLKANGTESYLFTDLKKFRNQVNGLASYKDVKESISRFYEGLLDNGNTVQ